jgi:hypothetical protein
VSALLAVALLTAAAAGDGDEPRVQAHVSSTEVTVGEPFSVAVTAEGPPGTEWSFPEQPGDDSIELVTGPPDPEDPAPEPGVYRYRATAFALEDVSVPAIRVGYRLPDGVEGELETEPVPLRIVSLLPRDPEEQQLADIRGPRELEIATAFWVALGGGILAMALLGIWIWRRFRPAPAPEVPEIRRAPDVEALAALEELARSDLVSRGAYRDYYIRLAQIAKRYLERRLGAPVLEMTSSEAVSFLKRHPHGEPIFATLRALASAADEVKFARAPSQAAEAERQLGAARQIVERLEQRLRPAPGAEGAETP